MTTMLISIDSFLEFDKDGLRLRARPSEELGAIEVFISFHVGAMTAIFFPDRNKNNVGLSQNQILI